ncbi:hypothetical protein EMGBS8_16560 [Verrucomicrobiota bacterium]|nr:hypothetical protein EMGBS8_16560 [Verrucomicrobiota bacterium]
MAEPALKITRGDIIARGILCYCPNCGQRGLLKSWFRLNAACAQGCGLDLAKSAGVYSGTTSIGYVAAIIFVIIPTCFLVVFKLLTVGQGVALGILGSLGFIVLIYPVMLCWMVMAYHVALPEELPANQRKPDGKR